MSQPVIPPDLEKLEADLKADLAAIARVRALIAQKHLPVEALGVHVEKANGAQQPELIPRMPNEPIQSFVWRAFSPVRAAILSMTDVFTFPSLSEAFTERGISPHRTTIREMIERMIERREVEELKRGERNIRRFKVISSASSKNAKPEGGGEPP